MTDERSCRPDCDDPPPAERLTRPTRGERRAARSAFLAASGVPGAFPRRTTAAICIAFLPAVWLAMRAQAAVDGLRTYPDPILIGIAGGLSRMIGSGPAAFLLDRSGSFALPALVVAFVASLGGSLVAWRCRSALARGSAAMSVARWGDADGFDDNETVSPLLFILLVALVRQPNVLSAPALWVAAFLLSRRTTVLAERVSARHHAGRPAGWPAAGVGLTFGTMAAMIVWFGKVAG